MNSLWLGVLVLLIVLGVMGAVVLSVRRRDAMAEPGTYPEGHFMGVGMAIGLAIGVIFGLAIGAAMGNAGQGMALGPGLGLAIGVAMGVAMEERNKDKIRPLTDAERASRRVALLLGIVILALGIAAFVGILLIR